MIATDDPVGAMGASIAPDTRHHLRVYHLLCNICRWLLNALLDVFMFFLSSAHSALKTRTTPVVSPYYLGQASSCLVRDQNFTTGLLGMNYYHIVNVHANIFCELTRVLNHLILHMCD